MNLPTISNIQYYSSITAFISRNRSSNTLTNRTSYPKEIVSASLFPVKVKGFNYLQEESSENKSSQAIHSKNNISYALPNYLQ
jgi:hypothetical protein